MKRILTAMALSVLLIGPSDSSRAVELLISGNFESPGGSSGEVPGWLLLETITNSSSSVDSAEINVGTDSDLWVKGFAGGTGLGPAQGNFDNDSDVDGRDFLIWQRGGSPTQQSAADLTAWQTNYGSQGGAQLANARLLQTVPAVAGETYTFLGSSKFEEFYSGLVTTLSDASPFGQVAPQTVTQFKMEFLNASNNVIGSPSILDLRSEWVGSDPGFYLEHTPLSAEAPAGTASVRVVAEALNMQWNGSTSQEVPGNNQSAFFNNLSLTRASAPGTDLLTNGNLNAGVPDALDFWNQQESPQDFTPFNEILRANVTGFTNHTPGGTRGVWLSAFFGYADPTGPGVWSVDEAVDGIISQTVGAVEGGNYTFSGWTKFEGNYSGGVDVIATTDVGLWDSTGLPSPTQTQIKLEFFDVDGVTDPNGPIASFIIDTEADRKAQEDLADDGILNGTGTANDNVWRQHTLQATAPAGARFARLTAQMLDGVFNTDVGGGQSAFFDDFSLDGPAPPGLGGLVSVPEPSSFLMIGLGTMLLGLMKRTRNS
jgi:hypothetical protein